MFTDADMIYAYSRKQALADGVLVDVTETAREAGFKVPVAMTSAVWEGCVAWTEHDDLAKGGCGQSEQGRLWDVLSMAIHAARTTQGDRAEFAVLRIPREGENEDPELVNLVLHIGPGDQGEPVCTVMEPGED